MLELQIIGQTDEVNIALSAHLPVGAADCEGGQHRNHEKEQQAAKGGESMNGLASQTVFSNECLMRVS